MKMELLLLKLKTEHSTGMAVDPAASGRWAEDIGHPGRHHLTETTTDTHPCNARDDGGRKFQLDPGRG
ncbi:hypothetical protein JOB18_029261 [Solea senegalensis]|uniref:Uncharacterized protein n=1 Tax=Solea senegalensis TaxID=28829 RepID=A0AAV6QV42_SOLSE|nr:hypothetical protein JOB18_029261 [Solea senegalensis]